MRNLKNLSNLLLCTFALMTMSILLTSCEQEELLQKDNEELLTESYNSEIVNLEDELSDNSMIDERANCNCSRMAATRKNSNSSYVYCHNFANNNSDKDITYVLYKPSSVHYISTNKYYAAYSGLTPGQTYSYRVRMYCDDGSLYVSPKYYFVQPN